MVLFTWSFQERMPTWGCILEAVLSSLLPVNLFFHFCCSPWSHGPNSSQTPRGEWESGILGAATGEEQTAMWMAALPSLSSLWGEGSDLSESLTALGQLLTNPMWWLILCVSMTGSQVFAYTSFLGVSVRMLWDEISIWIGRLSKADCPSQCEQASAWGPE